MSLASDFSALLMKRCSSSVGAYDLCRSSFSNVYSPCRVRTLERTVYSQLINADFPCSFDHEDTIRMSLDLLCSLCPVIAVHMFTGKTSIWYVYLFLMVDPRWTFRFIETVFFLVLFGIASVWFWMSVSGSVLSVFVVSFSCLSCCRVLWLRFLF